MHKSFRKWTWFWLFELFFKNEAFNQKSETVHLLGYGWTCFHDSSGPRKLILRMPRPYSEAHEKLGFQAFSSAKRQKVILELENSIFEKLFKMDVGRQNGFLITPQVSQTALGPISDLQNEFEVILWKMKISTFSKIFTWFSSMFYA